MFWAHDDAPEWLDIALGTLDGEPERAPDAHIFTKHKAAWVKICDDLPRYDESIPKE